MNPLPHNSDLLTIAPRVIWFEEPEKALCNPLRFLAYLMTYGTAEEISVVRRYTREEDFQEAIEEASPGIFDARSWAYWNAMIGRYPAPPMPRRKLPE